MQDRRKAPRLRTFKAVRVDMHPNWPTIDCTVRNLSSEGAALEVGEEFNTSLEYDLVFLSSQQKRPCRQVWRSGSRVGVSFVKAPR